MSRCFECSTKPAGFESAGREYRSKFGASEVASMFLVPKSLIGLS